MKCLYQLYYNIASYYPMILLSVEIGIPGHRRIGHANEGHKCQRACICKCLQAGATDLFCLGMLMVLQKQVPARPSTTSHTPRIALLRVRSHTRDTLVPEADEREASHSTKMLCNPDT